MSDIATADCRHTILAMVPSSHVPALSEPFKAIDDIGKRIGRQFVAGVFSAAEPAEDAIAMAIRGFSDDEIDARLNTNDTIKDLRAPGGSFVQYVLGGTVTVNHQLAVASKLVGYFGGGFTALQGGETICSETEQIGHCLQSIGE